MQNFKIYTLITLMCTPLLAFAQKSSTDARLEIGYNQQHSKLVTPDLYADGIKIKRDLSLIKKAQEQRVLAMDEIPADDLYGSIWNNSVVNPYSGIENEAPKDFKIDLTNFTMPTMGHVTSEFGWRRRFRRFHYGMDLKVQVGDTIRAAFDGKVRLCDYGSGYGNHVVLRHPNGLETVYGHLSKFLVSPDDVVKSGDPIALGGNTGRSTGSHLHFELRFLGKAINPRDIVDFENKVCIRDYYNITPQTFAYASGSSRSRYASNSKGKGGKNKYVDGAVKYHRVRQGESLYAIAKKYNTTVRKICALNSMTTKSKLGVGKSIRIS